MSMQDEKKNITKSPAFLNMLRRGSKNEWLKIGMLLSLWKLSSKYITYLFSCMNTIFKHRIRSCPNHFQSFEFTLFGGKAHFEM